jgi:hypothetical protein
VYLTSLRLRASEADVEAITATHDEIIVKFDRLPPLNLEHVSRSAGVALKRGSNQLRFARSKDTPWMERLYALVGALPHASATTEVTAEALPDVMATALRSA